MSMGKAYIFKRIGPLIRLFEKSLMEVVEIIMGCLVILVIVLHGLCTGSLNRMSVRLVIGTFEVLNPKHLTQR